MPADLNGKTVAITGASRGIGAAAARAFADVGANVILLARDREAIASLAGEIGPTALAVPCDVTRYWEVEAAFAAAADAFGGLDILINNASAFYPTPIGSISESHWDDLIGSNLKAPLFLSQAAWPHLKSSQGVIINLLDIHSKRPLRNHPLYASSKAGLAMLTLSLAKDMAPEVRVNGIAPGAILWPEEGMTESIKEDILNQVPLGKPGEARDIADCVIYLVRDATYVTGQIIAVDGGRSIGW